METKKTILWITKTAILLAMLVVIQLVVGSLGNQILTGSLVNLILIISVMTGGLSSGITVAAFSPIIAKFFGAGPLWGIIPFVMVGNIVLVIVWHLICKIEKDNKTIIYIIATIVSSILKFVVLFVGISYIAVPIILNLPEPQATVASNIFSIPQLITALIGGLLAILFLPSLRKALNLK